MLYSAVVFGGAVPVAHWFIIHGGFNHPLVQVCIYIVEETYVHVHNSFAMRLYTYIYIYIYIYIYLQQLMHYFHTTTVFKREEIV